MNVVFRAVAALACTPAIAEACPNCDAGRQAWSDVLSQDAALPIFASAMPFVLIGAICLLVERAGSAG